MKFRTIIESFPGGKHLFSDLTIEELDKFLDDEDITDLGQFTKEQKQWLYSQVKKGKLFKGQNKRFPRFNTMYSKYEMGLDNDFLPIIKK